MFGFELLKNEFQVQVSRVVFENWEGEDFLKNRLIQKKTLQANQNRKGIFSKS